MLNKLVKYFDLQADRRGRAILTGKSPGDHPNLSVYPQYVSLVLGITLQPYF